MRGGFDGLIVRVSKLSILSKARPERGKPRTAGRLGMSGLAA